MMFYTPCLSVTMQLNRHVTPFQITRTPASLPSIPANISVILFLLLSKMATRSGQREQRGSRKVETEEGEDDLTKVEYETSEGVEVIPTFDGIGLCEDLLRGIYAYGL